LRLCPNSSRKENIKAWFKTGTGKTRVKREHELQIGGRELFLEFAVNTRSGSGNEDLPVVSETNLSLGENALRTVYCLCGGCKPGEGSYCASVVW